MSTFCRKSIKIGSNFGLGLRVKGSIWNFFKRTDPIAFMSQSMRFGVLSLILVVASWTIVALQGLNYGIDFAGGTLIQVKYEGKAPLKEVRSLINGSEQFNGAQVNYFGSENEIVIRTKDKLKSRRR